MKRGKDPADELVVHTLDGYECNGWCDYVRVRRGRREDMDLTIYLLRTTGDLTSFISTRYAPALPDSNADMNKMESSSQSAGTCVRLAEAMIYDANLND